LTTLDCTAPFFDENGQQLSLNKVLPQSWSLLVLLRHAECIECNLIMHELNSLQEHLQQWNVKLVCIGNGQPSSLARVRSRLDIDPRIPLFSHPSLDLHKQLKLHNGFLRSWGPKAIWNTLQALAEGHLQTGLASPMNQQSGLVLLDPRQAIKWSHRSQFLGDIPNFGRILEQVLIYTNSLENQP
jgi:peroxiredoxin